MKSFPTPQAFALQDRCIPFCDDPGAATAQTPAAGWKRLVLDDLITQGNKPAAAQYFYETFLGLASRPTALQTKQFHALTKDFHPNCPVPQEKKTIAQRADHLLGWDQAATIQADVFSENYFDDPGLKKTPIWLYMVQRDFPHHCRPQRPLRGSEPVAWLRKLTSAMTSADRACRRLLQITTSGSNPSTAKTRCWGNVPVDQNHRARLHLRPRETNRRLLSDGIGAAPMRPGLGHRARNRAPSGCCVDR